MSGTPTIDRLRTVVVGHVDHGKSTLIGRLLHDAGALTEGRVEQLTAIAARRGMPVELANLADALQAERDQHVTIETTEIAFRTSGRHHVLIDAPGHQAFLRSMVTGASRADAAIVVIDAAQGIQEQSRRHGTLLQLLGLTQIVLVVNKLDLVGYSETVFSRLSEEFGAFLAGLGLRCLAAVPVSARFGDNVVSRSSRLPWSVTGSVLDVLDTLVARAPGRDAPLRLPVQDVYRFDRRPIVAGRIVSGRLRAGDELLFSPSGAGATIAGVERWHAPATLDAAAGESIGITLAGDVSVERGEIASAPHAAPAIASAFDARVFWFDRVPLQVGHRYRLRLATAEVDADIVEIRRVVDASTLAPGDLADGVAAECVGEVMIRTGTPVAVDQFNRVAETGRFAIVDAGVVCGGGIVMETR